MSKKKKNEKKSISILKEVDNCLTSSYDDLKDEVEQYQIRLAVAEENARKKARKAMKKNKRISKYEIEKIRQDAREEILSDMNKTNFLSKIENIFKDLTPIVILISRLIASLICAILSMDIVKSHISKPMLMKLEMIYNKAMSIA